MAHSASHHLTVWSAYPALPTSILPICSGANSAQGSPSPGSPHPIPQTLPGLTLEPAFLVELKLLGAPPVMVEP